MSEKSFLIVGLGNIGPQYALTRHNVGFMTLDAWAQASNALFSTERYGDICTIKEKGREYHLLKPSTYMNLSGNSVRYWLQRLNIDICNLIIICDDLNLPFATVRMRAQGSDGGHNGLKNIEELLQTRQYTRIRIGIGKNFSVGEQIDYVLGNLNDEEIKQILTLSSEIIAAIKTFAFLGVEKAMSGLNKKNKQ